MHRAPLVPFAIALLCGVVLEAHALTLVGIVAIAMLAFVRRDAAVGGAFGIALATFLGHPFTIAHELHTARYAGTVTGDVRTTAGGFTFPLTVPGLGTLRADARSAVMPGERLIVRGRFEPFDEPRNPGEPSAREIALDDGTIGQIMISQIIARAPPDRRDPRVWMPLARAWCSRTVHERLPEPEATVLAGALWGERGTLAPNIRDDFQATGTVHVLITAGLHLGVLATMVALLASWIGIPRITAALGTIPLVYGYAWFSGWHLPSQRAAAMIAVALVARAAGRRTVSLNTIAIAAIVVAAAWPIAVESVSFALSFSCVTAIVLFATPIERMLRDRRVPQPLAETLALSAAAQLGVWPLTAATFFVLAPYALVANALVVPAMGAVLCGGALLLAVASVPVLGFGVERIDDWLLAFVIATTHVIASLPGARLTIAPPPLWAITVYDGALIAARVIASRSRRWAAVLAGAAILVTFVASIPHADGTLRIIALDVGQGDAIVIRTPHGRTVMIDTGGQLERGATAGDSPAERAAARIVLPYLRRSGITSIDLMILTHPHGDHVGGCLPILRAVHVVHVVDSGQPYSGRAYRDCIAEAERQGVPITIARRGMHWTLEPKIALDVLAPTAIPLYDTGDDINENSVVLRLSDARGNSPRHALFMGDAGEAREAELLDSRIDVSADILKVGHHGSRYASTPAFIAAVHPRIAIISVGRHNTFGHPALSTIETLRLDDASIQRTDRCGAITVDDATALQTMLRCDANDR